MLTISIHAQGPGKPALDRAPPAGLQGRAFALESSMTNHLRARLSREPARPVARSVIDHDYRLKLFPYLAHQWRNCPRFIEAGNDDGAWRGPVHAPTLG